MFACCVWWMAPNPSVSSPVRRVVIAAAGCCATVEGSSGAPGTYAIRGTIHSGVHRAHSSNVMELLSASPLEGVRVEPGRLPLLT